MGYLELSVIIPVYNEAGNLRPLIESAVQVCKKFSYEILIIDDGSTDKTIEEAENLADKFHSVRLIRLKKNFGQTAALAAGIDEAEGRVIIPLDGDGQNDPADIPVLLNKMKEGYDVVSGWRKDRHDALLTRKIPSWCANSLISYVTGVHLHDYGCTMKAYRASLIKNIQISGEMHRFLPAWCAWRGGKVAEVPVKHHARIRGQSKYGLFRIFKVIIDLMTIKFFSGYLDKPNHLFSGGAMVLFGISFLSAGFAFYDKFGPNHFGEYRLPLLLFSAFLGIISVLLILLGLITELLVRLYFSVRNLKPYTIDDEKDA